MNSEWKIFSLGDLAKIKYGKNQKKVQSDDGKFPIYGTGGLIGYANKFLYDKPSVLIGRKGSISKVKFIDKPFWTVDTLFYTEINESLAIPKFLYYSLSSIDLYHYNEGTTIPSLRTETLNKLEINLPPLETQKKIAAVLSSLDDKIELNNQINKNLEQQAQAIFKSWFIDFEPFGGVMPDDWKILTLDDVSTINAGGDKPNIVYSTKTAVYYYPIYSNGTFQDGLYGYTNEAKIFEESVTVSARGTIGFVCLRDEPYTPIVRLITLIPKYRIITAKYLYLWLKNINIYGTGTTQQQLTVPFFKKTKILTPTYKIVEDFTDIINPLYNKMNYNKKENEILSTLRDSLLPKLMSGEIDVSAVEI